jgi:hypothetical protein
VPQACHGLLAEVTPAVLPLVVLILEHGGEQAHQRCRVGEDAHLGAADELGVARSMRRRGLEQGRAEAARAQLGDLQFEPARSAVEDPLSMAIAVCGAGRCALVGPGAHVRRCVSLDEPLRSVLENTPQQFGVGDVEVVEERLGVSFPDGPSRVA